MRHGIAEERDEFAKKNLDDHLRPLTIKGSRRVQKICLRLHEIMGSVDLIVSSPYTRARQTAEIAAQIFSDINVVEAPELVPSGPPQAFKRWLRTHADECKRVLVVGHEPHMSVFASYLLLSHPEPFLELKKGGVLCMEVESFKNLSPNTAKLLWLLPPRFLI